MLNVELLLNELTAITEQPETHDQGLWFNHLVPLEEDQGYGYAEDDTKPGKVRPSACGSFGCLAGNTAVNAGAELDWYLENVTRKDGKKFAVWAAETILGEDQTYTDCWGDKVTVKKTIAKKAQELLGLTDHQADKLFDGDNDLDRLWRLASQISAGEIDDSKGYYGHYGQALKQREYLESQKAKAAEQEVKPVPFPFV